MTIKKELLHHNKNAFRYLHLTQGFDFEKPYYIAKGEGRFTYNQVVKQITAEIGPDFIGAMFIKTDRWRDLHAVQIKDDKLHHENPKNPYTWSMNIDYFFGVGDFEDSRKNRTEQYYIIAQASEHRTELFTKTWNRNDRFRIKDIRKCGDGHGSTWISEIYLIDGTGDNLSYKYNTGWNYHPKNDRSANIRDYIDASGYLVREIQANLRRRAGALRMERDRAAAARADFTEAEKEIIIGIECVKLHLSHTMLTSNNTDDVKEIANKTDSFRWALFYWEKYQERKASEGFPSIKAVNDRLSDIKKRLINAGLEAVQ